MCKNSIVQKDKDGNNIEIFRPLSPYETPCAIEEICDEVNKAAVDNKLGKFTKKRNDGTSSKCWKSHY